MSANANEKERRTETFAFRDVPEVRVQLEAIQVVRKHGDLSETLREAVRDYVARHVVNPGVPV